MSSLQDIVVALQDLADSKQAVILQRFFKTGPGEYGAGDIFLGLKVPKQRQIALQYADVPLSAVSRLLKNKIHEYRLVALLILVHKYEAAADEKGKREIFDFYLKNSATVNNWDLVDLSAPKIVGDFLLNYHRSSNKSAKSFLLKLATSNNLWTRRIAIVSTFSFIRAGKREEVFAVAEKLLEDKHDLIHKAVGWMLREFGKRVSRQELLNFFEYHYPSRLWL